LPRLRDRSAAEVVDEVTPHETRARTRGDDPLRRRDGLELEDLDVLGLDLRDRFLLLRVPVLDLALDVLEHRGLVTGTLVRGELHRIDGRLAPLFRGEEVRFTDGVERLGETAITLGVVLGRVRRLDLR